MSEPRNLDDIKDNFSKQAAAYSQFRPGYPESLYQFILSFVDNMDAALDVATGNGQVANRLSDSFHEVSAIDISEKQMQHAIKKDNIHYVVARAETTGMPDKKFDLITVGQAAHWFDLKPFYEEVERIIKPGGVLALFGYQLPVFGDGIDAIVMELYESVLGKFWDPERQLVDDAYTTIHFPFEKQENPGFSMTYSWNIDQLLGFLESWSAVQHYIRKQGENPLQLIENKLRQSWGNDFEKKITFPVFLILTKFK